MAFKDRSKVISVKDIDLGKHAAVDRTGEGRLEKLESAVFALQGRVDAIEKKAE